MQLRALLREWKNALSPFIALIALIAIGVAIGWFLPSRTAAVILGGLAGAVAAYFVLNRARHTVKIAIMWAAIGVTADAAYAKLNDQGQVTIANALMKLVDGLVKLGDALVKSSGIVAVDARTKIAAVTPDFVWALILSLILFMWLSFQSRPQTRGR